MNPKFELKCGYYLMRLFSEPTALQEIITRSIARITSRADIFDAIAVSGLSGLMVGPSIALALNKYIVAVRKSTSDSHSGYEVEGITGPYRYLIIDDLISSGTTVRYIVSAIAHHTRNQAKCIGVFQYGNGRDFLTPAAVKHTMLNEENFDSIEGEFFHD